MAGDEVRDVQQRYTAAWKANDRAGWLATFATDATREDPVGGGVRQGHAEIGGFWDRAVASFTFTEGPDQRIASVRAHWGERR